MGIYAIEFAGFDERGDDRPIFDSRIMTGHERILSIEGNRPDCPLDTVVVDLDTPVSEEQAKTFPVFGDIVSST